MQNSLLYIALFVLNTSVFAQDAVSHFKAEKFNETVYLTWTIKQGFTCNGVDVLRSTDSINFAKIGDIEGICGSSAEEIEYDFTDISPEKNARNFYRLSLGGLSFSQVISIHVVDIPANHYLVVPNPLTEKAGILFENSTFALCRLTVFSPDGSPVFEAATTGESFVLRKEDYEKGVYFFRISYDNNKEAITGRFLVY